MAILRRAERAMLRAMCGVKLAEKRSTTKLMDMLGLTVTHTISQYFAYNDICIVL